MKTAIIGLLIVAVVGGFAAFQFIESAPADQVSDATLHLVARVDLDVVVTEQGTLESSNNTEIKCRVRGDNIINSVIESGTIVDTGDILVELETLAIDEEISERTKFYHLAESQVARSAADVARAKLAIKEYEEGRFISSLASLQKELAVAESRLLNATNRKNHSEMMRRSEFASDLDVEEKRFAVSQAKLNVDLTNTQIDVLQTFTKKQELVDLRGALKIAEATHEADVERAYADKKRLERAKEELGYCTIKAERGGLVIFPTGEQWKDAPEIEEGATVHKNQTLLLMPDLTKMQVKVGVHESVVDEIEIGMTANVTLNRNTIAGKVASVAKVAKPAGWWTGNVVKYDVIVELSESDGLKPGMSVEVKIMVAHHANAVAVPAAALLDTANGYECWVSDGKKLERRTIQIGGGNEVLLVVKEGLKEGEQVVLDPLANVREAQMEAAQSLENSRPIPAIDF